MSVRALIVACESYAGLSAVAGATSGALEFRAWLRRKRGLPPGGAGAPEEEALFRADVVLCAGEGCAERSTGNSRLEIMQALAALVRHGRDQTDEFHFFFSGHGFQRPATSGYPEAVLVAGDHEPGDLVGEACIPLHELQNKVARKLGGRAHYYFLDACRNDSPSGVTPATVTLGGPDAEIFTEPTVHAIFSAQAGSAAPNTAEFVEMLNRGLRGAGRAKRFVDSAYVVTYTTLVEYLRRKVGKKRVEAYRPATPEEEWRLFEQPPNEVPLSECAIEVVNAPPSARYRLQLRDRNAPAPTSSWEFDRADFSVGVHPNDYWLTLLDVGSGEPLKQLEPSAKEPVDLCENCNVRFQPTGGLESALSRPIGKLTLRAAADAIIEGTHLLTGETFRAQGVFHGELLAGTYRIDLMHGGRRVLSERLDLVGGSDVSHDLFGDRLTSAHERVLQQLGGDRSAGAVVFSEALGPLPDTELALWLMLLGASRITVDPAQFSKLRGLALASFSDVLPGASPLYLLTSFDAPGGAASVRPGECSKPLEPVQGLGGIHHLRLDGRGGHGILRVIFPGGHSIRLSTFGAPARVTLVAIAQEGARLEIRQLVLPLRPPWADDSTERDFAGVLLHWSRFAIGAQSRFARRERVAPEEGDLMGRLCWGLLCDGKVIDPVMSPLCAYEILRRHGRAEATTIVAPLLDQLESMFPTLPDVYALRRMLKRPEPPPSGAPLFLDGHEAAFDDDAKDGNRLDYTSPWTLWHEPRPR